LFCIAVDASWLTEARSFMDERSTQELESALAEGDLSPRKKAFAKEVLRRRYEGKDDWSLWTHAWLSLLGVLGLARTALRRIRGR
jgi:hypothetical protein